MGSLNDFVEEELNRLRQVRDELRVQAELASMEIRDQWSQLEDRWSEFEGKARRLREGAAEETEDIREAAKLLAEEIREGFEQLRSRL